VNIKFRSLFISILFIISIAIFEQLISGNGIDWFLTLEKPSILISLNLFYVVAGLCSLIWGFVLYRMLVKFFESSSRSSKGAVILIVLVAFVNSIWNYFFMGLESTWNGFIGMVIFLPLTLVALFQFWKVDKVSFWIFSLYVLWVVYDIIWIYLLWKMNV